MSYINQQWRNLQLGVTTGISLPPLGVDFFYFSWLFKKTLTCFSLKRTCMWLHGLAQLLTSDKRHALHRLFWNFSFVVPNWAGPLTASLLLYHRRVPTKQDLPQYLKNSFKNGQAMIIEEIRKVPNIWCVTLAR